MSENSYKFEITPLPYDYNALEPYIDSETMRIHHNKHLQSYVDNLNKALEAYPSLHNRSIEDLLRRPLALPKASRVAIMRNAGGVYNHDFFFKNMRSGSDNNAPEGQLADQINIAFGSFEAFQQKFTDAAMSVFGSGYAWLIRDRKNKLAISYSANQETPITFGYIPIISIDVWEHAYYLKHKNRRAEYIDDWWNVVNWQQAAESL